MGDDAKRPTPSLEAWAAEARADEAIAERRRTWWRSRADAERTTVWALLAGLAERRARVVVQTTAGRRLAGEVVGMGVDVVLLRAGAGTLAVPLAALAAVRTTPGGPPPSAAVDGVPPDESITLAGVLADHEGDEVAVAVLGDPAGWRGTVLSVGTDVVLLGLEGGASVVVALQSLSDALLPTSTG